MTKEGFNAVYNQRLEMCRNIGNIRPLTALVHQLVGDIVEGDKSVLIYINKVQRDLYEKGILPFEVQSVSDRIMVDGLPPGDACDFLRYVWLAYRRKAEDWYWDEELQQYASKNGF